MNEILFAIVRPYPIFVILLNSSIGNEFRLEKGYADKPFVSSNCIVYN